MEFKKPNLGITVSILCGIVSVIWLYTQLLVWREEGHDHMLTVANIVITLLLWALLFFAIYYVRRKRKLPPPKLVIRSASYAAKEGGGKDYDDIAECLQQMVAGDSLVLDIENHNFVINGRNYVPKDPKPEKEKRLLVRYSFDGSHDITIERPEHSRVVLPEDSYLKEKATTNSALDLSALQEETISLARDLNEMLIDIGHFPLTMAFSSVIINGVFERSEEEKHAIEAHRIKLVHRFYVFDGRLGDLQQSYGELGIARQSLDQFRGNTTSDEIRELIKTLYELAVLIDEGYPRKSL